ncbi:tryptophan 2,3-dioxygenase family protein [Micromonospora sp. WMMA1923]|uniref:tryptophan 2,3-dioxygenase family protein n=1 Tax=Micromonospora sp. WMMA1923 TaxID=3404125 RepID=UPI003B95B978
MPSKTLPAVLPGGGTTDYARYLRTDDLLALQRGPAEWVHPDELMFQIVHQSAELWLKLARTHLAGTLTHLTTGRVGEAELLLRRACLGLRLITDQLQMLRQLQPAQFALIRTVLGNGSGFESPGWQQLRSATIDLDIAFTSLLTSLDVTPAGIYREQPSDPLYRLAEALVDLDERIASWRTEHYQLATRIIGADVLGTRDMPVNALATLISHRRFPSLWQARTELTDHSPRGRHGHQDRR